MNKINQKSISKSRILELKSKIIILNITFQHLFEGYGVYNDSVTPKNWQTLLKVELLGKNWSNSVLFQGGHDQVK